MPYSFDEFFSSNREEAISPFLTSTSRKWAKNLSLKSACLAALLLALSFYLSFISTPFSLLCLAAVYFFAGTPALINTLRDFGNLEINIDVLMTLSALLSVLIGSAMEGALLLVLFELSGSIETMVTAKTRSSVARLHRLSPRVVSVIGEGGVLYQRAVEEVERGDCILIKAGEVVPLDGEVIEGRSHLNLVHLTGESQPVLKRPGDQVPAGAGNLDGTLTVRVTYVSADSTLSRIIRLITEAQESKPRIERFLDSFGRIYAFGIILSVFVLAILLPWILNIPYLGREGSIYRVLTFLIAASPCALVIATPTAYLSAISCCARKGILLKGGSFLDAAFRCGIIAFDKTGTLTTGQLTCTEVRMVVDHGIDLDLAIAIAASLERHALHPIARAMTQLAEKRGISLLPVENFLAIPGYGLQGIVGGFSASIGNLEFIQDKIAIERSVVKQESLVTYLCVDRSVVAFYFQDKLRPDLPLLFDELKEKGYKVVILSGDHFDRAQSAAEVLGGVDEVFGDLRPEDKLKKIELLSKEAPVMMVGDGINDAPALTRATVGISMGKIGSATAVDASDVIFIHDDISILGWFLKKARHTRWILRENLTLAIGVIIMATTPAIMGLIPLWLAVILHEGGTVLVGLNSLRLLKK